MYDLHFMQILERSYYLSEPFDNSLLIDEGACSDMVIHDVEQISSLTQLSHHTLVGWLDHIVYEFDHIAVMQLF